MNLLFASSFDIQIPILTLNKLLLVFCFEFVIHNFISCLLQIQLSFVTAVERVSIDPATAQVTIEDDDCKRDSH